MTDQSEPTPQRIGDVERDQAAEYLRDHLALGRLDQAEFDDRLTSALTARTRADLDPLFTDLPGPKPGNAVVPATSFQAPPWQAKPAQLAQPTPAQTPSAIRPDQVWGIVSGVAWTAAIIVCFATSWDYWWIMLIPIFFPWWSGQQHRSHRHH